MDELVNEAVRRLAEELERTKHENQLLRELNDSRRRNEQLEAELRQERWTPLRIGEPNMDFIKEGAAARTVTSSTPRYTTCAPAFNVSTGGASSGATLVYPVADENDLICFNTPPASPTRPMLRVITPASPTSTRPMPRVIENIPPVKKPIEINETNTSNSLTESPNLMKFFSLMTDQMNLARLPTPEPTVFTGDPLQYSMWRNAFETLIESRGIPPAERMHYLQRYLGGAAQETVEGFFLVNTEEAFNDAKRLLFERFGDDFVVANAFRDKLDKWEKLPRDKKVQAKALRLLGDFLRQCDTLMKTNRNLDILNDERENQKILEKLPDWVVTRWARIVGDWREKYKNNTDMRRYPPFANFVHFINKEANLANDPVTSLQTLRGNEDKPVRKSNSANTTCMNTQSQSEQPWSRPGQKCILCLKDNHTLDNCRQFLGMTLTARKDLAKVRKLCYGCLKPGHASKFCRNRLSCKTCNRSHPTSLHGDLPPRPGQARSVHQENEKSTTTAQSGLSHRNDTSSVSNLSSLIVPVWVSHRDHPSREKLIYAMLDTQSDTTFVLRKTCDSLGIKGVETKLLLSTMFAENRMVDAEKISGLVVRGYQSEDRMDIPVALSRDIMPANKNHIPTPDMAKQWPHLQKIANRLIPLNQCEVGMLIGYNIPNAMLPLEVLTSQKGEGKHPYAIRTPLGWGIIGPTSVSTSNETVDEIGLSHRVVSCEVPLNLSNGTAEQTHVIFQKQVKEMVGIMEMDFQDTRQAKGTTLSMNDKKFLSLMEEGIHQDDDQHYEMPLPFKDNEDPSMPNNRVQALKRLQQIRARFKRDPNYCKDYTAFMQSILKNEEAELVPVPEINRQDGHQWYVPHFGIYNAKKPGKIRVVFDCSAAYGDISLNDMLLQGPDLNNSLLGVLLRFRTEPVAVSCDVSRMFHQFRVQPRHRDYVRFLWWPEGDFNRDPVDYRMKVHIFGAKSSPACCSFGLKQIAIDNRIECGNEATEFVMNSFYVDDGLTSVPTTGEARDLIKKTKEMCGKGGLKLHKFLSNSAEVMGDIPECDRANQANDLPCVGNVTSLSIEKALGVQWCIENDAFKFRITLQDKPLTRRGILSTIGSIYDPLGLVAPVLLPGKRILQELCKLNTDWDSPLPEHLQSSWEEWRSSLPLLENISVQRCYKPEGFGEVKQTELHHMSDASTVGYGQCSYLRLVNAQDQVHCSLVIGKSRVAPLKPVTIPRLELTAAVTSVMSANFYIKN